MKPFPISPTIAAVVAIGILCGSTPGQESSDAAAMVRAWPSSLELDPRVPDQVGRFIDDEDGSFSEGYTDEIARTIRSMVFEEITQSVTPILDTETRSSAIAAIVSSEPAVEIRFLEEIPHASKRERLDAEKKFEEGFIVTRTLAFIPASDANAKAALEIYTSADFRRSVSSRVALVEEVDGLDCVETKGITALLSPTSYCSRITNLHSAGISTQHSQSVSNDGGDFQTIYFKESVKTLVEVPDGLVLHYVNYLRASKVGGLKRKLGKGKMVAAQKKAIEELTRRLDGKPATSR